MVEPAIRLSALQPRIRLTSLLMEALINLRELLSVGASDTPGGPNKTVNTTVRNNFTDCLVTDAINVTVGQDYIIDFTKEDNRSYALRFMADLNKTKYYKFANSDRK